jgi:hypothetical protein
MSLQEEDTLQAQNAYDKMLTFFTGRAKHQRISRERAIKFPLKVRLLEDCYAAKHRFVNEIVGLFVVTLLVVVLRQSQHQHHHHLLVRPTTRLWRNFLLV